MNTITTLRRYLANAAARMPRSMIALAQVAAALALAVLVTACDTSSTPHH